MVVFQSRDESSNPSNQDTAQTSSRSHDIFVEGNESKEPSLIATLPPGRPSPHIAIRVMTISGHPVRVTGCCESTKYACLLSGSQQNVTSFVTVGLSQGRPYSTLSTALIALCSQNLFNTSLLLCPISVLDLLVRLVCIPIRTATLLFFSRSAVKVTESATIHCLLAVLSLLQIFVHWPHSEEVYPQERFASRLKCVSLSNVCLPSFD